MEILNLRQSGLISECESVATGDGVEFVRDGHCHAMSGAESLLAIWYLGTPRQR